MGPYDELEKKAEDLENQSKIELKKKDYALVISLLEETKAIYSQLGFHGKIGMLNQRITRVRNLVKFEEENATMKTQHEQDFKKRVDKVLSERQRDQEQKIAQLKKLPPEIMNKLDKVTMLKEKADREEKQANYPRVIGRYEYILELYKSIPKDLINLSMELSEVEKKLSILRTKT